jgi:hypothetical protein
MKITNVRIQATEAEVEDVVEAEVEDVVEAEVEDEAEAAADAAPTAQVPT